MRNMNTRLAVGLATLTAGLTPGVSASAAEAAPLSQGAVPEATAASFGWANVGGDPLVPGGIDTRQEYVKLITSDKGATAMRLMGLNYDERAAWKEAARKGEAEECGRNTGAEFEYMSYGAGTVSVDKNVKLTDPDYKVNKLKGFCLDVVVRNGKHKKVIETFVAEPCANLTIENQYTTHTPTRKPKKALVTATKYAKDSEGKLFPKTPTGEFEFVVKCMQNRKPLTRKVTYNHSPQNLANCDTGKKVTVSEVPESKTERAQGKDLWINETPLSQTQTNMRRSSNSTKGANFVFVNKQVKPKHIETPPAIDCSGDTTNSATNNGVGGNAQGGNCSINIVCSPIYSPNSNVCTTTPPTPPEPPKPNTPPTGRGDVPHRYEGTTDKVCVDPNDVDGDAVTVSNFKFTNTSSGENVGQIVRGEYKLNGDIVCVDWKAPNTPQSVTWTADLEDARGAKSNSTPDEFPVLANDTGDQQS